MLATTQLNLTSMKVSKAEADYSFGVDVLVVVRPESCYRLE